MTHNYLHLKTTVLAVAILISATASAQTNLSRKKAEQIAATELKTQTEAQRVKSAADWAAKQIRYKDHTLKFTTQTFGEKPAGGRSLYISLHGGGGTTPKVNDQQWENQKKLYQPKEGVYFVPRSPKDAWNMWHDYPMDELLAQVIKGAMVMEDVNPDKVYIMGYSAGGDGVFQLGPRLADHWAAAAMMAGHPGDMQILNLKNVPFAIYMGGKDAAYKRNELAAIYGKKLDSLADEYKGSFVHDVHIYPDMPHWMGRKDTIAVPWMSKFTRNALPNDVIWVQDDILRDQFYWLGTDVATAKQGLRARVTVNGNKINIIDNNNETLYIYLNDNLLDLNKKVIVSINGVPVFNKKVTRNAAVIKESIAARLDRGMVFTAKLIIKDGKVSFI